jgi:MFS family permease
MTSPEAALTLSEEHPPEAPRPHPLSHRNVQLLMASRVSSGLAGAALYTIIGYQVYMLTRDPLALGLLGLVEAIPALTLSLVGGHVADRMNRKPLLAWFAQAPEQFGVLAIYAVVFLLGIGAGFSRPAFSSFVQQAIPEGEVTRVMPWLSSAALAASIAGAPLAGFAIDWIGVPTTYVVTASLFALTMVWVALIPRQPTPVPEKAEESFWESLKAGVGFVFRSQPLVGSMALDLFAVLFGGAMALLPAFAADILHVGATGLGWLRTAPAVGALLVMLYSTRWPPTVRAGRNLLWAVAGFGISMIVFGYSTNFYLSLAALFFSGFFDGISMVIRSVIVQIFSPENMRGRINAVNYFFIGASNEIGAFESGLAAAWLGVAPAVFVGGFVTMGVVALVAWRLPELRTLRIE